jgi:oxygen-independent coproporphyrinogen-3 oxidase
MRKFIKNRVRKFLVGKEQLFKFISHKDEPLDYSSLKKLEKTNLYIHIPFCKSMCPYCPYNRVLFQEDKLERYFLALHKEIDLYHDMMGPIEVESIYIGGGTPTNAIDYLDSIIDHIKNKFNFTGHLAIETTVADINKENLDKLQDLGVNLLSIGVQSFNDKYLDLLGRNYPSKIITGALRLIDTYDFETVNIDLMFAFPNQSEAELLNDLIIANQMPVDQVTVYPLFTFPYSSVGNYLKINKIKMPNFFKRKKYYKIIVDFFKENHYEMASVWGFKKNTKKSLKYSSVTRNQYIGFGAGAGSKLENVFYFNTFSIENYQNTILTQNELPISIHLKITKKLSNYYWFYWKLYETNFITDNFNRHSDFKMKFILSIFRVLGLIKENDDRFYLTERGAFWIHLLQNIFVLDYINNVWNIMKKEAFPKKIDI